MWDAVARFAKIFLKALTCLSPSICFLHDSSHSYEHMLWEFRQFWPRLRDGGLLVSHDVQMNAAFPEFVTKTYAHKKRPAAAMRSAPLITNGAAGATSASR
jgi:cephalosporin hydroxylase